MRSDRVNSSEVRYGSVVVSAQGSQILVGAHAGARKSVRRQRRRRDEALTHTLLPRRRLRRNEPPFLPRSRRIAARNRQTTSRAMVGALSNRRL